MKKTISFTKDFELLDLILTDKKYGKDALMQEHWIFLKALKFISQGSKQSKEIAKEALKTLNRKFIR